MPGKATAIDPLFLRLYQEAAPSAAERLTMRANGAALSPLDRGFLLRLQCQALQYFVDNQAPNGLMLDRQSNHGPRRPHGLCSTSATGMGFIALALASAPPYRLLSPQTAIERIQAGLLAFLERLPHDRGVVPHFTDSATNAIHGADYFSTIETSWLLAGALWSAAFLRHKELETLAAQLYERVDWHYWTAPDSAESGARGVARPESSKGVEQSAASTPFEDSGRATPTPFEDSGRATPGLLRHGKGRDGRFLACSWDRLNGETVFMYVLAAGAGERRAVASNSWAALRPFYGTVAGLRFNNADLGLFVFQYGLDLLDLEQWRAPGQVDLLAEARLATLANRLTCHQASTHFATYRRYWGLSAGDGPADPPRPDTYRCYAPSGPIDGTAHLTATLASIAHDSAAVLENLHEAAHDRELLARGRYGFSNINLDRRWVSRDMVGIDMGAAVLALDNYLENQRIRAVFQGLPHVSRGLNRLGFSSTTELVSRRDEPDKTPPVRQAS